MACRRTGRSAALKSGVDIVVACPGRLEDLMRQRLISLDAVEITVIDEADHMADLGFLPGVTRILAATPAGGQRLLFSATLDNGVDKLVKRFLRNEVSHSVDCDHVARGRDDPPRVPRGRRRGQEGTGAHASPPAPDAEFCSCAPNIRPASSPKQLTEAGIPSVDLHGNLSQPARDRNLAAFTAGTARVLVATDIAARGVHVDDVELVVHIDPPTEHKAYLHRSGRTARAGQRRRRRHRGAARAAPRYPGVAAQGWY